MKIMNNPLISSIPWGLIEPHEAQAQHNHRQSLRRLNERGGLGASEAVAILEDRPWRSMPLAEATARLKELVDQFNGRTVPALVPAVGITDRLTQAISLVEAIRDGKALAHRSAMTRLSIIMDAAREALR